MDYIFGYGSIIGDVSRLATLGKLHCNSPAVDGGAPHRQVEPLLSSSEVYTGGNQDSDKACGARLICKGNFLNWKRSWSFRSPSGFTALGIHPPVPGQPDDATDSIFGVVFPIESSTCLASFDEREIGYVRLPVPIECLNIDTTVGCRAARQRAVHLKDILQSGNITKSSNLRFWVYVPMEAYCLSPNEEYPIIQTYLDVCIRGCICWGGAELAKEFLRETHGWSRYYLNDAPLSRRPWLHRPEYKLIDEILEEMGTVCMFHARRHPEEYSAEHLSTLKGLWGVPPRNLEFVGRSEFLSQLHELITDRNCNHNAGRSTMSVGSRQAAIVGLGGVGKTQTATEYVHRNFINQSYGLVIWLRSTAAEDIASDMRRFAFDMGVLQSRNSKQGGHSALRGGAVECGSIDFDDDKIAEEIRRKLSRCRCNWLVVLDNVEDASVVDQYLPYLLPDGKLKAMFSEVSDDNAVGKSAFQGHVLVTTRYLHPQWEHAGAVAVLDCFRPEESIYYLHTSLGLSDHMGEHPRNNLTSDYGDREYITSRDLLQSNLEEVSISDRDMYLDLAKKMGYLPLALAMAAAYMRRCDVDVREYVRRLDALDSNDKQWHNQHHTGIGAHESPISNSSSIGIGRVNTSIVSTFNISLDRIRVESDCAAKLLPCLGFLYPDNITKPFIAYLIASIDKPKIFSSKRPEILFPLFERYKRVYESFDSPSIASVLFKSSESVFLFLKHALLFTRNLFSIIMVLSGICLIAVRLTSHTSSTIRYLGWGSVSLLCLMYLLLHIMYRFRYLELHFTYDRLGINHFLFPVGRSAEHHKLISKMGSTHSKWIKCLSRLIPSFSDFEISPFLHYSRAPCVLLPVPAKMSEHVSAERDSVWELMVQFSILTVRGRRNVLRIGSIHRLQQNVILAQCSKKQAAICLEHCVAAIAYGWSFDTNTHDFTSWDNCGQLLPHIEVLSKHVVSFMQIYRFITSVKQGGPLIQEGMNAILEGTSSQRSSGNSSKLNPMPSYCLSIAVDLSEYALNFLKVVKPRDDDTHALNNSDVDDAPESSSVSMEISPFLPHNIRWRYLMDLAYLLMQAGLYSSVVLSKFDSAQSLLDVALDIMNCLGWWLHTSPEHVKRNFPSIERHLYVKTTSDIMYHLGKTLRYNSLFEKSKEALTSSLEIRQGVSDISIDVSDTLHELGVLNLKIHNLSEAEMLLKRSLDLKKQIKGLKNLGIRNRGDSNDGDTTEASTLHQLGVVSRAQKKYEYAEELLHQSLACAEKESAFKSAVTFTSRAATIQQLGRIALRRGLLSKADTLFNEALQLYEKSYGENHSATHVNTIAVRHQLGNTAIADKRYEDACGHYSSCLKALETLYGDSIDPWRRYDIVFEMQALWQAYLLDRKAEPAETYMRNSLELIKLILLCRHAPERDEGSGGEILSSQVTYTRRRSMLLKAKLSAICCLRNFEKKRNNFDEISKLNKEANMTREELRKISSLLDNDIKDCSLFVKDDTEATSEHTQKSASELMKEISTPSKLCQPIALQCTSEDAEGVHYVLEPQFSLVKILGGVENGSSDAMDLLIQMMNIILPMRFQVRVLCKGAMQTCKTLKTSSNNSEALLSVSVLQNSVKSIAMCSLFIRKNKACVCLLFDQIEALLNENQEVMNDMRKLKSFFLIFFEEVDRQGNAAGEILISLEKNGLRQVDEAFEQYRGAICSLYDICDSLRKSLKSIGISVEDNKMKPLR